MTNTTYSTLYHVNLSVTLKNEILSAAHLNMCLYCLLPQ